MIKLPAVFASGALFQHGTDFDLRGEAKPLSAVTAELMRDGRIYARYGDVSDADGRFRLTLSAPGASFDEYCLSVRDPDGEARLENILFGELWIASGQSNMEMTNIFMRGKSSLYGRMSGKKLRIFAQDWLGGLACDGMFPFEPQPDLPGAWIGADDTAKLDNVSACASAAILELYDRLNRDGAEVPVGFLNVSVGATAIEAWIPRESFFDGGRIEEYITKLGRLRPKRSSTRTAGSTSRSRARCSTLRSRHWTVCARGARCGIRASPTSPRARAANITARRSQLSMPLTPSGLRPTARYFR